MKSLGTSTILLAILPLLSLLTAIHALDQSWAVLSLLSFPSVREKLMGAVHNVVLKAEAKVQDLFFIQLNCTPESFDKVNATFHLFTRRNRDVADLLIFNQSESIVQSHFRGENPTKFVIHGYMDRIKPNGWMIQMKDALLDKYDANVVLVDWSGGNGFPYNQAAANTWTTAEATWTLIQNMANISGSDPADPYDQFQVIGHSLGAHTAGFTGKKSGGRLGRITGLDPAGPEFWMAKHNNKLWRTDAKFVDVIHTNAVPLLTATGFGLNETLGHVDFWPNGGDFQPGCGQSALEKLMNSNCDHQRPVWLYTDSLREHANGSQLAVHCESKQAYLAGNCTSCNNGPLPAKGSGCATIGDGSQEWYERMVSEGVLQANASGGSFYLATTSAQPFYGHQYALRLKLKPNHGLGGNAKILGQFGNFTLDVDGHQLSLFNQTFQLVSHMYEGGPPMLTTVFPENQLAQQFDQIRLLMLDFVGVPENLMEGFHDKLELIKLPTHSAGEPNLIQFGSTETLGSSTHNKLSWERV